MIIEFYGCGECDRCDKNIAEVHLRTTSRFPAERVSLHFCWDCMSSIWNKVYEAKKKAQGAKEGKP